MTKLLVLAAAAALASAGSAAADEGAPGTTFPEQPPAPLPSCSTVASNPGTGIGGEARRNESDTAQAIQYGLIFDACVP